jgi:nucleotide-binding universal stress UspA family protein
LRYTSGMGFQKILCPTDFSDGARRAMAVAARLAREAGAELVVAHAWHVPAPALPADYAFLPQMVQQLSEDAQRGLDDAAREAVALGAPRVAQVLLSGVAWAAIVDALADPAFDLVVIGTRGRTGLARVLLGSVAEKVVRHAPCPVLAVPPPPPAAPGETRAKSASAAPAAPV